MKRAYLLALAMLALWQTLTYAQVVFVPEEGNVPFGGLFDSGQFFVALITGGLLALAFQVLLTNFSLAAGLSAFNVPDAVRGKPDEAPTSTSLRNASDKVHKAVRGIGAGFGIWSIITVSLSLFFASWLAVRLSGTATVAGGVILGLVIWGFFYMAVTSLEAAAAASAVGALASVAKKGFHGASHAVASIFEKSEEHKAVDQAAAITAAVRDELMGSSELRKRIGNFFDRVTEDFGPERRRRELEKLLDDVEIKSFVEGGGLGEEDGRIIMQLKAGGGIDTDKARSLARNLKNAMGRARAEPNPDKSQADKALDAVIRATGLSVEESEALRHRVENLLRKTGRQELNPDGIKHDLMNFFQDPKSGLQALRSRVSAIGRETATAVINQQHMVPKEQAEMIVERVMGAIQNMTGQARDKSVAIQQQAGGLQTRALDKIEAYLADIDRPDLDPISVRSEIELLFDDPKAGFDALYDRAKNLTREDVKALLSNNSKISPEQADKMVDQVMAARDKTMETAQTIKTEVHRRLDQAKDDVVHQAEEVRKTAASAAWWIFAGALTSGVLSAIGGWLAARPTL